MNARVIIEALYGITGSLESWRGLAHPALVSMNTRVGEKPYRITWFTTAEHPTPLGHLDLVPVEAEALAAGQTPAGLETRLDYYGFRNWKPGAFPKPELSAPEPANLKPDKTMNRLDAVATEAQQFLEDFPPVGVNRAKSRRERLRRMQDRKGYADGRNVFNQHASPNDHPTYTHKAAQMAEGDAQPGYDVPCDTAEEQTEVELAREILSQLNQIKGRYGSYSLPLDVIKRLKTIEDAATALVDTHSAALPESNEDGEVNERTTFQLRNA